MTDLEVQKLCLRAIQYLEVAAKAQKAAGETIFKIQDHIRKPKLVENPIAVALTDAVEEKDK